MIGWRMRTTSLGRKTGRMDKYSEIFALYEFCKENGIECRIVPLYDGHKICLQDGNDFVQHKFSYCAAGGCVEPNVGDEEHDYTPVPLEQAKKLVLKYQDKLNRMKEEVN